MDGAGDVRRPGHVVNTRSARGATVTSQLMASTSRAVRTLTSSHCFLWALATIRSISSMVPFRESYNTVLYDSLVPFGSETHRHDATATLRTINPFGARAGRVSRFLPVICMWYKPRIPQLVTCTYFVHLARHPVTCDDATQRKKRKRSLLWWNGTPSL